MVHWPIIGLLLTTLVCITRAAELVNPTDITSTGGTLTTTLTMGLTSHAVGTHTVNTRTINGAIPGPTLRLSPGDTLNLNFVNSLNSQATAVTTHNALGHPDTSNMHFHGAHVSGELPSDDVTHAVEPGTSYQYTTQFPANHMPGTHWIHPHFHGASALQVGGGAAAALIVEDPVGYLPSVVANAAEKILLVQHWDLGELREIAQESGDLLGTYSTGRANFLTINGQLSPKITVKNGEWQRWRIIFGGWREDALNFQLTAPAGATGSCETQLLSKDGIYISDFPRAISRADIPPGGRADLMVRCTSTSGSTEVYTMNTFNGALGTVEVLSTVQNDGELTALNLALPDYLTDLRNTPASAGCSCITALDDPNDIDSVNGIPFTKDMILHETYLNAVVERTMGGVQEHPYHQHVYPFQLISNVDNANNNYFKSGDWHDVYMNADMPSFAVMRYQPRTHAGTKVMIHCHRLMHEDEGMMAMERVRSLNETQACTCGSANSLGVGLLSIIGLICVCLQK